MGNQGPGRFVGALASPPLFEKECSQTDKANTHSVERGLTCTDAIAARIGTASICIHMQALRLAMRLLHRRERSQVLVPHAHKRIYIYIYIL